MSFLNLPDGIPGFNRAIISLWFRVPKKSLEKLKEDTNAEIARAGTDQFHTYPRLHGIMPLLTFGQLFEGYKLGTETGPEASYTVNNWHTPGGSWELLSSETHTYSTGPVLVRKAPQPVNPSVIGIMYVEESGASSYKFIVHLQTRDRGGSGLYTLPRYFIGDENGGSATGEALGIDSEDHWDYGFDDCITNSVPPGNPHIERQTVEDATDEELGQDGPDSFKSTLNINVTPDHWHHALISFDLSRGTSSRGPFSEFDNHDCGADTVTSKDGVVSNPCQLWVALDDKNYINEDATFGNNSWLSRYNQQGYSAPGGFSHYVSWGTTGVVKDQTFDSGPAGSYTFPASPLPSAGFDFGVPAGANVAGTIRRVEMAELQVFTGIFKNTQNTTVRRAFVDKAGKPVVATQKKETDAQGNIIKDSGSIELLEKTPVIWLHGSANWKKGVNTSVSGAGQDQVSKKVELFAPVARIETYMPDPSLRGDQGETAETKPSEKSQAPRPAPQLVVPNDN